MYKCKECMALWRHNGVDECLFNIKMKYIKNKDGTVDIVPKEPCPRPRSSLEYAFARKEYNDMYRC